MKLIAATLVFLSGLLLVQSAVAEGEEPVIVGGEWGISLGAFFADQHMVTEFGVNVGDVGADVDFEDDLGLRESQAVFRLAAFKDFNTRHQLIFDVFDLSQTSVATLESEIEWGDTVFPISADVSTGLDLTIYKIGYSYFLWRKPKFRLGLTGGLYIADIGLRMRWQENDIEEVGEVTAPLPVLGLRGEYFLSDRWRLSASAEWFGLEIDEYDGTLEDIMVGIDYQMTDRSAIGVGYNIVDINVDATEKILRADLMWEYSGYFAYLRFTF